MHKACLLSELAPGESSRPHGAAHRRLPHQGGRAFSIEDTRTHQAVPWPTAGLKTAGSQPAARIPV
jgi:hypothetical protein